MISSRLPWIEAILSGFRLVGRRPAAALCWALVFALAGTIMGGVQVWVWRDLHAGSGLVATANRLIVTSLPLNVLTFTMVGAAIMRAEIRPNDRGAGLPRFGGDELRLLVFVLPLMLLSVMVTAGVGVVLSEISHGGISLHSGINAMTRLNMLVLIVLGARLVLAAPMTLAERRFGVRRAVGLSRGLYGRLVTILVATLLLSTIIEAAGSYARDLLAAALGADQAPPVLRSQSLPAALNSAFGPVAMLLRLLGAAIHTVAFAAQVAPIAYVYRWLASEAAQQSAASDGLAV